MSHVFSQQMEDLISEMCELGVGSAPSGTICSTLLFNTIASQTTAPQPLTAPASSSQEQPLPEEQPGPSTETQRRRPMRSTFYKVFEAHSERRTAASH